MAGSFFGDRHHPNFVELIFLDNSIFILYNISKNEVLYRGRIHEETAVNWFRTFS